MPRKRLTAACFAVLMTGVAAPALAQSFQSTPVITDATQAPLALPRAQPAIPTPEDKPYPGVIHYRADITDLDRFASNYSYHGSRVTLLPPPFAEDCVCIADCTFAPAKRAEWESNQIPIVDCDKVKL